MRKRFFSILLTVLLLAGVFTMTGPVRADEPVEVTKVVITLEKMNCGDEITEEGPKPELTVQLFSEDKELEDSFEILQNEWASEYRGDMIVPFTGIMEGDETYHAFLELKFHEGLVLAEEPLFESTDGTQWIERVLLEDDHLLLAVHLRADHINDHVKEELTEATCVSTGLDTFICAHCGYMIVSFLPVDPDAHAWSEWEILQETTTMEKGKKTRKCTLCGAEETAEIPKKTTEVYEPDTSWALPSTITWRADETVIKTAHEERRPSAALVWLDASLNVYDRNGVLISKSIDAYVKSTSPAVIPAFCFQNEAEAKALNAWLQRTGFEDCFVVSSPQNQELIKDLTELRHVHAIFDFTALEEADPGKLAEMAMTVNGAHGNVVLLNPECATRENIQALQSICATVWVKAPSDLRTLLTLYTNGADGVLVDDYEAAIQALEKIQNDGPALLRIPQINDVMEESALREFFSDEQFEAYREILSGMLEYWDENVDPEAEEEEICTIQAGRHRGLVRLPKEYETAEDAASFAEDFLSGIGACILDQPEAVADQVVEILAEDLVKAPAEEITKPQGRTRAGERITLDTAELVTVEKNTAGTEMLAMWRYQEALVLNGENHGNYWLYSAPFSVTIEEPPTEAPTQATTEATTEAPTEPEPPEKHADVGTILLWILLGLASAAFIGAITMIVIKLLKKQK